MPPRQHRLLPERPAPRKVLTPLNTGFAGGLPAASSSASSFTRALAASSTASTSQVALEPPRSDGQDILPYKRGSKRLAIEIAADSVALASATEELKGRVFAKSNLGAVAAKKETWTAVALAAGYADPFVPDPDLLYAVCAALWKAQYRSLDSYIAVAKQEMILLHGNISDTYAIHIKRVSRAAARGRGPAKQATDLPFSRFQELENISDPLTPGGPGFPGRVAVIASWWMLREIELMNITLDCVLCEADTAKLLLPISKTDTTGKGTSRLLCCTCASTPPSLCPFHVFREQAGWASSLPGASATSPLCPNPSGAVPSKKDVVLTIQAIAQKFHLPLFTRSGAPLFTGHSFRVTGAMWLAASGIDVWRIQLHGRWGSDTVLRYVRLAPLAKSLALEASLGKDLSEVRSALLHAKAALADLAPHASDIPLEDSLAEALGPLATPAPFLGKPTVDQILGNTSVKGWHRRPKNKELLVANIGPPNYDGKLHPLRPPQYWSGTLPDLSDWQPTTVKTWCGWNFRAPEVVAQLQVWDTAEDDHETAPLCGRCFGKRKGKKPSSSSSDSE